MNSIIKFYKNSESFNNKNGGYFEDIMEWDDYELEVSDEFIKWLFPIETKLTVADIKQFKTDTLLRKNVLKATTRMLLFYGFEIDEKNIVKQVKPLIRIENKKLVGLSSIRSYKRVTRILNFLVTINMEYISAIFFLSICRSLKTDCRLLKKAIGKDFLRIWMSTQKFLINSVDEYDTNKLTEYCNNIIGLKYTQNSCYMDSVLLCTFAIPNKTINDNILHKDLNTLKNLNKLWSRCDNNIDTDIKLRQDIQEGLNNITYSMRGLSNDVKTCTPLRKLIRKCPGSQSFHGTGTQDAGEFLSYLFNIFQVDVAKIVRKTYGSNDVGNTPNWVLVTEQKDNYASPIIDVVSTTIKNLEEDYNITEFVRQEQDDILGESDLWTPNKENPNISYSRRKEVFEITESPIVIFNILRTYVSSELVQENIWKRVSAPEEMNLKGNKLNLTAIVVHTGDAHYVANFKYKGVWFWYDDSHLTIKYVGSYDNMLQTEPTPMTNGTIFFYT